MDTIAMELESRSVMESLEIPISMQSLFEV